MATPTLSSKSSIQSATKLGPAHNNRTLDVCALGQAMGQSLACCFQWKLMNVLSSLMPRAIHDTEESSILPTLCVASSAGSARSSALASSAGSAHEIANAVVGRLAKQPGIHALFRELHVRGCFLSKNVFVNIERLQSWQWSDLQALSESGVLVLKESDFGETLVCMNDSALRYSLMYKLCEPFQHARLPRVWPDADAVRRSKLELILQLHLEGWRPSETSLDEYAIGTDDHLYLLDTKRPNSYFLALLSASRIGAKGVTAIPHNKGDAYYKVLLNCTDEETLLALADCPEQSIPWHVSIEEDGNLEEVSVPAATIDSAFAAGPLFFDADNIVQSVVETQGFARQIADSGPGTESCKIYFDNYSGSSNGAFQRGFMNCPTHCCIRYSQTGADTIEQYCAKALLWYKHREVFLTKSEHLAWQPSEAEVLEQLLTLRLQPF